jgi:hypothetical protein
MAQNTKGTVAAILGRISQFSGDYDYVVIQLGSQNERYLASANDSFRLVYDRATIQGRAWLESGDVYAFARQKDVPTAFLTTEPTESLPPTTSP